MSPGPFRRRVGICLTPCGWVSLPDMRTSSPKHLGHGRPGKWNTAGVLLDESAAMQLADFGRIFGNTRPMEVEIGTGKGTFLVARAAARPEINFLGIEYARPYCLYAADRFRRHGLTNVRMVHTDAAHFVKVCIPDRSLWRLHVYFPDPWPKRRHHRRRLIQPAFVAEVRRVLQIGGQFLVVTDHMGYFEQIRRVLLDAPGLAPVAMPRMTDAEGERVGTNFERKYIAQGRASFAAARLRYA